MQTVDLQDGDLLLCSNGLTSIFPEDQIAALLRTSVTPEAVSEAVYQCSQWKGQYHHDGTELAKTIPKPSAFVEGLFGHGGNRTNHLLHK